VLTVTEADVEKHRRVAGADPGMQLVRVDEDGPVAFVVCHVLCSD
jgi:hypothetical protein